VSVASKSGSEVAFRVSFGAHVASSSEDWNPRQMTLGRQRVPELVMGLVKALPAERRRGYAIQLNVRATPIIMKLSQLKTALF